MQIRKIFFQSMHLRIAHDLNFKSVLFDVIKYQIIALFSDVGHSTADISAIFEESALLRDLAIVLVDKIL